MPRVWLRTQRRSAIAALSLEFTTLQRDVALAALNRCGKLGCTQFNAALGESQTFEHPSWIDLPAMAAWLLSLPAEANSGDVYARLA